MLGHYIDTLHPPIPAVVPIAPLARNHQTANNLTTNARNEVPAAIAVIHRRCNTLQYLLRVERCTLRLQRHIDLKLRYCGNICHTANGYFIIVCLSHLFVRCLVVKVSDFFEIMSIE